MTETPNKLIHIDYLIDVDEDKLSYVFYVPENTAEHKTDNIR